MKIENKKQGRGESQCKPWIPKARRREGGGGNDESLFEIDNNVYIKPRNTS